jgi:hypothetical protein
VTIRRWKARPLPGVRTIIAWVELAARVSRIITPPLAHGSVFWSVATRAINVASPEND